MPGGLLGLNRFGRSAACCGKVRRSRTKPREYRMRPDDNGRQVIALTWAIKHEATHTLESCKTRTK